MEEMTCVCNIEEKTVGLKNVDRQAYIKSTEEGNLMEIYLKMNAFGVVAIIFKIGEYLCNGIENNLFQTKIQYAMYLTN